MRGLILAAMVAALAWPAAAQSLCGPHDAIVATLVAEFGETLAFVGRHPTEPKIMEVFLNADTGTFSVLVSRPETSCVTATGVAGASVAPTPPGDPS